MNCSNNQLATLDVSQNEELIMLYCSDNPLNDLDLSRNKKLKSLLCEHTLLLNAFGFVKKNKIKGLIGGYR